MRYRRNSPYLNQPHVTYAEFRLYGEVRNESLQDSEKLSSRLKAALQAVQEAGNPLPANDSDIDSHYVAGDK